MRQLHWKVHWDSDLNAIINVVASVDNVQRAVVYGSRAKGNYRPNSDIDIMLFGDSLTFSDIATVADRLDDLLLPWQIDITARNRVFNSDFIEQVDRYGKVIFNR